MENRNEKIQELDLEQMDKISGGTGDQGGLFSYSSLFPVECPINHKSIEFSSLRCYTQDFFYIEFTCPSCSSRHRVYRN